MTDAKHSPTIKLPLDSQLDDNFGWIQLLDNDKTVIAVVKCEHYEQIISAVNGLPGLVKVIIETLADLEKRNKQKRLSSYEYQLQLRLEIALADAGVKP